MKPPRYRAINVIKLRLKALYH